MEKTPLELYETAYKFQYYENRISDAIKYYEKLITEFPDSNECGYAAIQIQKIKASDLAKDLKLNHKPGKGILIFLTLLCITMLFLTAGAGYYFYNELKTYSLRDRLTTNILSKIYSEDYDEALRLLSELKKLDNSDITPFELSADIYRKKGNHRQAQSEYDTFFRLNPDREPSARELEAMQKDANAQSNNSTKSPSSRRSALKKNNTTSSKKGSAQSRESPENQKSNSNSLYIVDPDSISYF